MRKTEKKKKKQYYHAVSEARTVWPEWKIRVIPLVVGVRGKVSEKTLRTYMKRMKLNDKTVYRIQKTLTRGAMVQVTKMMEARWGALKIIAESSSQ